MLNPIFYGIQLNNQQVQNEIGFQVSQSHQGYLNMALMLKFDEITRGCKEQTAHCVMQDALIQPHLSIFVPSLFNSQSKLTLILGTYSFFCFHYRYFYISNIDIVDRQLSRFFQLNQVEIIKYRSKVDMTQQKKFVDMYRSLKDQSIYQVFYPLPADDIPIQFVPSVSLSKFVKCGQVLGYVQEGQSSKNQVQAPISGTLVDIQTKNDHKTKGKMLQIFSIKLCQHFPKDKNQSPAQNLYFAQNKSILQVADICAVCEQPVWFYYQKKQKQVTLKQLKKCFEEFDISDFEWKVVLNEQFTKDTELGGTSDQSYSVNETGKVTYLFDFSTDSPGPETIVLKYKNVICKHEKISNGLCVFCLTDVKSLKNFNFRRYLFQFDQQNFNFNIIVSGKALQDQAALFKNKLIKNKKVLLVLDLDNTILHSISLRRVGDEMMKQIDDFAIIPPQQTSSIYIQKTFVKFRPNFQYFLAKMIQIFQIFIYTKGTRLYAEQICRSVKKKYEKILEGSKNFLPHRIISRDEDPNLSKKNLDYIIPKNREIMLILDDRRDVWNHSPLCVFTRPYIFFYEVAVTEDGKTRFEPVEWEKGGGTLQHKLNQFQVDCIKQIEKAEVEGKEDLVIKKMSQLQQQMKNPQNQKIVVCLPQNNLQVKQKQQDIQQPVETNATSLNKQGPDYKQQQHKIAQKKQNIESSVQKKQQKIDQKQAQKKQIVAAGQQSGNKQLGRELKNNSSIADEYLITTLFALKQAHYLYFQKIQLSDDEQKKEGKFTDLSLCFQEYKKSLMDHISAYFIARDYKKNGSFRRSQKMGLRVVENTCEKIDILIRPNNLVLGIAQTSVNKYYDQIVKKMKSIAQQKKIPIVSETWLDICYEYNCLVEYSYYQPEDPYAKIIFSTEAQIHESTGQATVKVAQKIKKILEGGQIQKDEKEANE